METFHKLLQSQLKEHIDNSNSISKEYVNFFEAVNEAYCGFENNIELVNANLQTSSNELLRVSSEIRAIIQSLPGLLFRIDKVGTILDFIAGSMTDIYFSSEQLIGKTIQSLHPEYIEEAFELAIRRVQELKSPVDLEYYVLAKGVKRFYTAKLMLSFEDKIIVIILNTTKNKRNENALHDFAKQLERNTRYVTTISAIHSTLHNLTDSHAMFEQTVEAIFENMDGVDYTGIYIVEGNNAVIKSYRGYPKSYIKRAGIIPQPKGYTWKTILNDEVIFCPNTEEDVTMGPAGVEAGIKCYYSIPLHLGEKAIGTIHINSLLKDAFDENDKKLFEIVAQQLDYVFTNTIREEERKNLMEELESKNAEMERFSYTVSHDLKSPLITIKGFLGMLVEDVATGKEESVKSDIERIHEAADKMTTLLDEVLELSRVGRVVNELENVPLEKIINDALSRVYGRIKENEVKMEVYPELPVIFADRQRFVEVFQNLIDNAIKYMGDQPEPTIEIGIKQDNNETVCYVKDNGIGIDPRYHDRVFELFNMLDPESDGTGIGLTMIKRIIEMHGGRIWVESDGVGKGSTFCFILPKEMKEG